MNLIIIQYILESSISLPKKNLINKSKLLGNETQFFSFTQISN